MEEEGYRARQRRKKGKDEETAQRNISNGFIVFINNVMSVLDVIYIYDERRAVYGLRNHPT